MEPSLFLLATPQSYYVFLLDGLTPLRAGTSLKEVYDGLKDRRLHGFGSVQGPWPEEEWAHPSPDESHYFPMYTSVRNTVGTFKLVNGLKQFPNTGNGLRLLPDQYEQEDDRT
jgi:hypothetical protein